MTYLRNIPILNIIAPKNKYELADAIKFAAEFMHPLAIRYPRGEAYDGLKEYRAPFRYGKSEIIYKEKDIALIAAGSMVETAVNVRNVLKEKGYNVTLVNARFVKPVDEACLEQLEKDHYLYVTLEENVLSGGFGESILKHCNNMECNVEILNIAIPNLYVEHGNIDILKKESGIDTDTIVKKIMERINQ